jgi:trimeric autotransporter adhesin
MVSLSKQKNMKKKLLLVLLACIGLVSAYGQGNPYDDAILGNGTHQFNYVGNWAHASGTSDPYFALTVSYSNQAGNYLTFNFNGYRVTLNSAKASHHGIIAVSIDNGPETNYDLYSATRQDGVPIYTSPELPNGNHTLKVRVTGTKNAASSNTYAIIDYVTVFANSNSNTATGTNALANNLTGEENVAYGHSAMFANISGYGSSAFGYEALKNNTTGYYNDAIGTRALTANTTGYYNQAYGPYALSRNTTGRLNVATGAVALFWNVSGFGNTAHGYAALQGTTTGNYNTAVGIGAGSINTTGSFNTAIGANAGNAVGATGIEYSTALGYGATNTGSYQVRIGNSNVSSIGGQVSWSTLSDGRFKKDIKEDVSGLDFISKLRPVSYTVDREAVDKFLRIPDSLRNNSAAARKMGIRQTGFVAQEVDAVIKKTGYVFHGVEAPQSENEHYSIRYAEFVVPLVKAVQELNTLLKEQSAQHEATTAQHAAEITALKEQLRSYEGLGRSLSANETLLYQNNPNPFSSDTEIKMSLPESTTNARVIVYNMEGRQLKELIVKGRGETSVKVSASEFQAGMYLYALLVDGKVVDTKRMILTK